MKEEYKKGGLLTKLENIKGKNEELLNTFSATNKVSKTPENKVDNQNKQNKILIYNSQHRFVKFKDIGQFKELLFDSMHKTLKKCDNVII